MRRLLARCRLADEIPPDVYRALEQEEATALKALEAESATLEPPAPIPNLTTFLDMLESLTWDSLDIEAWREAIALVLERVEVLGLGSYRLT